VAIARSERKVPHEGFLSSCSGIHCNAAIAESIVPVETNRSVIRKIRDIISITSDISAAQEAVIEAPIFHST
jgi:hypothetical protein